MILQDGVVRGPAEHGLEDAALVGVRSVRIVGHGVDDVMGRAGGIGEVVFAVVLVQPRIFEIAAVLVAGLDRGTVFVEDHDVARCLGELEHIVLHEGDLRADGVFVPGRLRAVRIELAGAVFFELAAPEAAEAHVDLAVVVHERARVDAEAAGDALGFGLERAFRDLAGGNAEAEIAVLVAGGEHEVVGVVLERDVRRPHLRADPRDIVLGQRHAAVDRIGGLVVHAEHVVILHLVLVAVVVVLAVVRDVVGRVDVELVVEHVGGRVRGENVGDERFSLLCHRCSPGKGLFMKK